MKYNTNKKEYLDKKLDTTNQKTQFIIKNLFFVLGIFFLQSSQSATIIKSYKPISLKWEIEIPIKKTIDTLYMPPNEPFGANNHRETQKFGDLEYVVSKRIASHIYHYYHNDKYKLESEQINPIGPDDYFLEEEKILEIAKNHPDVLTQLSYQDHVRLFREPHSYSALTNHTIYTRDGEFHIPDGIPTDHLVHFLQQIRPFYHLEYEQAADKKLFVHRYGNYPDVSTDYLWKIRNICWLSNNFWWYSREQYTWLAYITSHNPTPDTVLEQANTLLSQHIDCIDPLLLADICIAWDIATDDIFPDKQRYPLFKNQYNKHAVQHHTQEIVQAYLKIFGQNNKNTDPHHVLFDLCARRIWWKDKLPWIPVYTTTHETPSTERTSELHAYSPSDKSLILQKHLAPYSHDKAFVALVYSIIATEAWHKNISGVLAWEFEHTAVFVWKNMDWSIGIFQIMPAMLAEITQWKYSYHEYRLNFLHQCESISYLYKKRQLCLQKAQNDIQLAVRYFWSLWAYGDYTHTSLSDPYIAVRVDFFMRTKSILQKQPHTTSDPLSPYTQTLFDKEH